MSRELINSYSYKLASLSPRRRHLLKEMNIEFEACSTDVDESYPEQLQPWEVALFLSKKKSDFFESHHIGDKEIIITADTLVSLEGNIIPKPEDLKQAIQFLHFLSGKMHIVFTGVTLKSKTNSRTFLSESRVWFRELTSEEIEFYISHFNPIDKAGAYGIQEWIGYVGIERIEGSFYNVMGLPTSRLYTELLDFISEIESLDSL